MNGMSSQTISITVCGDCQPSLLEVGVVDADLRLAGRALLGELPVGDRRAVEVERAAIGEILGGDPAVVLAHEGLAAGRRDRRPACDGPVR